MAELLTAAGQLELASEFRFDFWHTEYEHRFFAVRKGWGHAGNGWAITKGSVSGPFWDGDGWNDTVRGRDAYRYELEEALMIARHLAFEENQRMIAVMERLLPGEFKGGPCDQAARTEDKNDVAG